MQAPDNLEVLIQATISQIESERPKQSDLTPTLNKHLELVAQQLVATDPLMGPFNFDASQKMFDAVVRANIDTVKEEFKSVRFGVEFAKKIIDTSNPTDCPVLNTACKALKVTVSVGSSAIWLAECVNRAHLISDFFIRTLGNQYMWNFITGVGDFVSNPTDEKYEQFKGEHPIAFRILSQLADIANWQNFIFIAHICLSKWAMYGEHVRDPVAAGAAAGAAAAAAGAAAAAAAPNIPLSFKDNVFSYGTGVVKKVLGTACALFTLPSSCLLGFGWNPSQYASVQLDSASAWALMKTIGYLQTQDVPFQQFMMRVYTSMRFGGCYDELGLDPRLVSICVMGLRSNKRQQILERLTTQNGLTISVSIEYLRTVYPDSMIECPTDAALQRLELELDGHKSEGNSQATNLADTDSHPEEVRDRLRDLLLHEVTDWTYLDYVKEIASDSARKLALNYVQPVIERATVAAGFNEPAAKVNPLLMSRDHVTQVSGLLPQESLLEVIFESARKELEKELSTNSMLSQSDAKIIADNCKKHMMWAWGNQRELVLEDGKLVYKLVANPVEDVEKEIREYDYAKEEKKLKTAGITHRGIFGFFRYACTTTATAAAALAERAIHLGTTLLKGAKPKINERALQEPVRPSELVPLLVAFPPPTSSVGVVNAAASSQQPAAAAPVGQGGRSRSRKRSASKGTRRKGKQASKKLKRKSRRYVRRRRSTRRKN